MEHKTVKFDVKEVDEETGIFEGHAATFTNKPDSYGDVIDKGAFTKTIKEMSGRVKILWNHSVMEPIGKPVELKEDEKGLWVKAKLSLGVQRAKEVLTLIKDGVITEMSIGYETIKEEWEKLPGGLSIRHLKEIKLYDTSPVTFAANPDALITAVKEQELELKPFPNEHACRLNPPEKYDKFRRGKREHDGKEYIVIYGKLKDETKWEDQAFRYNKETWEVAEARAHCKDHEGSFEAAEKVGKSGRVLSAANITKIRAALNALQALLDAAEAESEPDKSTQLTEEAAKEAAELEAMIAGIKAENDGFDVKDAEKRIESILEQLKK